MTRTFGVLRAPATTLFGRGAAGEVGRLAAAEGTRAFVCSDPGIAATPILSRVIASLRDAGLTVEVYSGATPDLPVADVDAALEAARPARPDVVVGVGGGTSLDLAKLVALGLSHPGRLEDRYGENRVPGPVLPVVALPTTSGTGSEVTPVAVVSDAHRALKVGVSSAHLVPRCALCDPALTDGCPRVVTAHSGIDALTHAIEAFSARRRDGESPGELEGARVFVGKNDLSDTFALEAIARIGASLEACVREPGDTDARDAMAYGATLAGLAFAAAGTSAAHALQYPLGARTSTSHGLGVGLLLPYAMEFNLPYRVVEFATVGEALGVADRTEQPEHAARRAIERVASLVAAIGIPSDLASVGVGPDDLEEMATQAATITRLVENNPRPLDDGGLLAILEAAYAGDRAALRDR